MKLRDYLANTATSHTAFAFRIGVSQAAVSRYASGARIPGPEQMARIAAETSGAVTANDFYPAATSPDPGLGERGQPPIETPRRRMVAKPMTPEREAAMAQWREENAEATRSYNDYVDRHGLLSERWRRW